MGRVGVLVGTRSFKHIAAVDPFALQISRLSADSHQLFCAPVTWLELFVADSPVLNCEVLRQLSPVLFVQKCTELEVFGIEPVGDGAPVFACTADPRPRLERAILPDWNRA